MGRLVSINKQGKKIPAAFGKPSVGIADTNSEHLIRKAADKRRTAERAAVAQVPLVMHYGQERLIM